MFKNHFVINDESHLSMENDNEKTNNGYGSQCQQNKSIFIPPETKDLNDNLLIKSQQDLYWLSILQMTLLLQ